MIEIKYLSKNDKGVSVDSLKWKNFYLAYNKEESYFIMIQGQKIELVLWVGAPYWIIRWPLLRDSCYSYTFIYNWKKFEAAEFSIVVIRDKLKRDLLECWFKESVRWVSDLEFSPRFDE